MPGNDVVYDCMAWNGRWVPYLLTVSLWDIGQDYEEKSDKHNEITARWDAISKEMTSNNKEEIKNDSNH